MEAYLDNAASTPVRPEAVEAMLPWLTEACANPSGAHAAARAARRALDDARDVLGVALGCGPGDVVFTAGGTEADNLAVFGAHEARPGPVVASAVEHPAVRAPVERLGGVLVGVDGTGALDLDALGAAVDAQTTLVSVMLVNNETGHVEDLDAVAEVVRARAPQALVHTDAVQAMPWLDLTARAAEADLISISAHKFGGPKGVGALVVRPGATVAPRLIGGGQERERRAGTQNVAGIVAMAAAAAETVAARSATGGRAREQRDRLVDGLVAAVDGVVETGGPRGGRVPGIGHVCIEGIESEALLFLLEREHVFASAASSCASGAAEPSPVLAAMGVGPELARGALRLSLGWATTDAEIDAALVALPAAVRRLREHP